jgi:hypothetical protein
MILRRVREGRGGGEAGREEIPIHPKPTMDARLLGRVDHEEALLGLEEWKLLEEPMTLIISRDSEIGVLPFLQRLEMIEDS